MKTQSILLATLAAAPSVLAHTTWTTFYVDGVSQGDGVAMRMRMDPATATFPLDDYASDNMACNVNGTTGVARVQSVPDGSTLTFEMRSWPNDPSKGSLAVAHKGPCAFYLKKVDSAIDDKGAGDGWFKLYDDGYDASTDQWCTDRLIANSGRLSIKLPQSLQGGYYLARPEVVALHNATNGDAQFYTGCAQIFVNSTGNLTPESTVSIPGYVQAGEPSVKFNIYMNNNAAYKVPGPPVANLSSGAFTASSQTTQTEGLRPAGCIDENANWCGEEVPSYSDETGCWASSKACWNQSDVCYKGHPPSGYSGCDIWAAKCQAINDACTAKDFNGPPDQGKDLTPKAVSIDIGLVLTTVAGGVADSSPKTSEAPQASSSAAEAEPTSAAAPYTSAAVAAAASSTAEPSSVAPYSPSSVVVPASEMTPAPTQPACPTGYKCIYQYTTEVVTVTQTVTVDVVQKRSANLRRRGHRV